jgi:DNA ligase-1
VAPSLSEVVYSLQTTSRGAVRGLIEHWLDRLDATGRWALLKLLTGGLRVGVSARLTKQALADLGGAPVSEIEEIWHAQAPPYGALFAWLEGRGPRPDAQAQGRFRPVMLAQPVDPDTGFAKLDPADYVAEWKWDGIRVQASGEGGVRRLYTRTGDDISRAFPDVIELLDFDAVVDGELLVMREGRAAPFGDLQKRLNRNAVDAKLLAANPAGLRAYDLLAEDGQDTRRMSFMERRGRLERLIAAKGSAGHLAPAALRRLGGSGAAAPVAA